MARRLAVLFGLAVGAALISATPASALTATQRLNLRVLLLSADGTESTFFAWKAALDREGVPYDAIVANTADPIVAAQLSPNPDLGNYNAVVLATGGLVVCDASGCFSALDAAEWAALNAYQAAFGVRRVTAYAYPSPEYGLNWPFAAGDASGATGALTAAGATALPSLVGPLPIDVGTWGYQAEPLPPAAGTVSPFTTLVAGPAGPGGTAASLVGVHKRPDGFDELVVTFSSNPYQLHAMLLAHDLVAWATRGLYLGYHRNYFTMHIDDVFLPDDRWDMVDNKTYEDDGVKNPLIRMKSADVDRALAWQTKTKLQLDLVFNGAGSVEAIKDFGTDALTTKLVANRSKFYWINHTYSHPNLDLATSQEIIDEIKNNISWAKSKYISINRAELVTGEHSGLKNLAMPGALTIQNIRTVAEDNSKQPVPYKLGTALTVPRHPSNVYYNVGTFAEQLDEYNYLYFENCVNTATTTCLSAPATWDQYVDSEATIMLRHVLTNDPRPHYFHQANLAEDGTFYPVADEVLARYKAYVKPALAQPTFTNSSTYLQRHSVWQLAKAAASAPNAYYKGGLVYVTSPTSVVAPLSGTTNGALYGGLRSTWVTISAGQTKAYTPVVPL